MVARPSVWFVLFGALASLGAEFRTQNFYVYNAPTPQIAQQVAQYAEHYRKEKAKQWLGQEMPPWGQPCPVRVTVTASGAGGATTFEFDRGQILSMDMHIEGPLDRLLASVLPHEVTHTVFAYYFRQPLPRWADEGGSVLSEDDLERNRHDQLVRQILNSPGRAIPLRRLFTLMQYPRDVMVLYAEGYSVSNFLVEQSSRPQFLAFIAQGMRGDWDSAVRAHYKYNSVEEMEQAWLQRLRDTKQPPRDVLASGSQPGNDGRVMVRQTAPPVQPLTETARPIVRGQMPEDLPPGTPRFLPDYDHIPPGGPAPVPMPGPVWSPLPTVPVGAPPNPMQLGPPRFEPLPPPPSGAQVQLGQPIFLPPPPR
jgi:hypothetical protein